MTTPLRLPGFEHLAPDSPKRRRRSTRFNDAPATNTIEPSGPQNDAGSTEGGVGSASEQPHAPRGTSERQRADDEPAIKAFTIDVVRSARRKRTVGAQLIGGVLRITVPSWMTPADAAPFVRKFDAKFRRAVLTERVELSERAAGLAKRYGLRTPTEIRWVDDMTTRWASCTSATGVIRMSARLANFPPWVVDYVIVHELAHLTEPNHSSRFWSLVNAYPMVERATGYLLAKSADADTDF